MSISLKGIYSDGVYPIVVQGIGENGKKGNTTIYLDVFIPETLMNYPPPEDYEPRSEAEVRLKVKSWWQFWK